VCAYVLPTYPGDGRDGEHFVHGGRQVLEAPEEVGERGVAPAAGGSVDVLLLQPLLVGDAQGDRHGDDDQELRPHKKQRQRLTEHHGPNTMMTEVAGSR
jgi:hypothetical protein